MLRATPVTGDGAEGGPGSRPDKVDGDLSERLQRLRTQVERKNQNGSPGTSARSNPNGGASPMGQAMRLSSEFIGGVVVGGALGWGFDALLGTKPWGLMVFLVLGFATGIYNVMRISGFTKPETGRRSGKKDPEGP